MPTSKSPATPAESPSARTWLIVLLFLATVPFVGYGAASISSNSSDVSQWMPAGDEQRQQYDEFLRLFGADDFLFLSWPGATLVDPRLDQVKQQLAESPETRDLVSRVTTGAELVDRLIEMDVAAEVALWRLEGVVLSKDHKTTGVLVQLADDAMRDQRAAVDSLADAAVAAGVPRDELKLGGSAYEAAMVEKESFESYNAYMPFIVAGTAVLMLLCVRNVTMATLILSISAYCYFMSAALIFYTGGHLNAVLIILPVLVYVLVLSGCIHLANYYWDAVREHHDRPARAALAAGWMPCVVATLTTAIGLASLAVSQIGPVRHFGIYCSIALVLSLALLLVVFPALLELAAGQLSPSKGTVRRIGLLEPISQRARRMGRGIGESVLQFPNRIALIWVLIVAISGAGLLKIKTSVRLEDMFLSESQILRDYRWMESTIGPLVPIEILVRFDRSQCDLDSLERLDLLERIEAQLLAAEGIGGVMSAVSYLPQLPQDSSIGATIRRSVVRKKVESNRDILIEQGFLADTPEGDIWRVSARVPEMHEADYEVFMHRVRDSVNTVWDQHELALEGVSVSYTGLLPMINMAQHQLLDDLFESLLLAILIICPLMMIVLRSVTTGLIAMIPNVFPIVFVFGLLSWLGKDVNIGSMLTACVALGIAVDDTMHFLTWYRRGLRRGLAQQDAIREAYGKCARAMIQTTVVAGLGLLVLVLSTYVPTANFALLIAQLLTAALLGDLLLLPAILAGPIGRWFEPREAVAPRGEAAQLSAAG